MLAKPWMFTAEGFGSHLGFPRSTSPRNPRICDVSGATTTSARASCGWGNARTTTGRCFAADPKSTVQTSPGCASIFAKGFIPDFSLIGGWDQPIGICGDGKGHILSKFHLGEEHVEGIAGFDSQAGEDFFGTLQAVGRHPGAEEGGRGHGSKVLVFVRDGKGIFAAFRNRESEGVGCVPKRCAALAMEADQRVHGLGLKISNFRFEISDFWLLGGVAVGEAVVDALQGF